MKRNNNGFSLIELIVTICVMAVVTSVGLLSFGLVSGRRVISCAEEISGYIGKTRVEALSRDNAELEIWVAADGVYVNLSLGATAGQDTKVGKTNIAVKYKTSTGAEVTLTETQRLSLSFDRGSGAFECPGL